MLRWGRSVPIDHFDVLARHYDRLIPFARLEKMIQVLALPARGTLLDAGGGTGRVAQALRAHMERVIVADISRGMLNEAARKNLITTAALTERLPFADDVFERVLMVDALHHVVHQQATVHELYRVLKPGGRLVIEEPDVRTLTIKFVALAERLALMRSHFLSPPQIADLFNGLGAHIAIETEGYNAWVLVNKPV